MSVESEQLEAAFRSLVEGAQADAQERIGLYDQMLDFADAEFLAAKAVADEFLPAVAAGLAPEWMQEEYVLARYRMNRMARLYNDRRESRALAEMPAGVVPETTIAIGDTIAKRE